MVSLDTTQKFSIQVAPLAANGSPGAIDGPPSYPVDVAGIVAVTPSADGLSCEVKALAAGSCTITPTALAGGRTITGAPVQVTVTQPLATQLQVTVGPVEQQ